MSLGYNMRLRSGSNPPVVVEHAGSPYDIGTIRQRVASEG
jgi:hypothetical protein